MPASFLGELFGTMVLILFGNGAVANVLLTQSKGNWWWLDRDYHGLGLCRDEWCIYCNRVG